jgi:hypothetical protein
MDETLTSLEILLTEQGLPAPSRTARKTHLIGPLWARTALWVGGYTSLFSGALLILLAGSR